MAASVTSAPLGLSTASLHRSSSSSISLSPHRHSTKSIVSALPSPYGDSSTIGLSSRTHGLQLKLDEKNLHAVGNQSYGPIEARSKNPIVMPAVLTPAGPLDLSTVLFRNRIIFIGQQITPAVAQQVISQLVTLAAIDENADILVYINCPGGSIYSVLAIYDCMSWIKPKVGTVCFGIAASHASILLAGGEKGMRYAMPNARIMIHQPQGGCGGHVLDVRRQVDETVQFRHKIDKMYAAFTGQPIETVQDATEWDRFFSVSEAIEFGLIDGALETEY
ncbi:hypothetical protein LguiA_008928 [Lonicera macranthoides]